MCEKCNPPRALALFNNGELTAEHTAGVDMSVIDLDNTRLLLGDAAHSADIAEDCETLRWFAKNAGAAYLAKLADSLEEEHAEKLKGGT